jgi:hypothetical protein
LSVQAGNGDSVGWIIDKKERSCIETYGKGGRMKRNSPEQENELICIDEILNVRDYQREERLLDA